MTGTWQPLANQPPFSVNAMLLLTDGSVFCQQTFGRSCWKLTPDRHGDYLHGTWTPLSPMKHARLYYASAVLSDGRAFVAGGEYGDVGNELNAAEIYDPVLDTWTSISTPPGWLEVGDAPCCVLPDGRLLLGSIYTRKTAIYDPATNTWSEAADKDDVSSEETWTLLPDGSVLTVECSHHPKTEKYLPALDSWVSAGVTPVDLVQASSIEIGPALLLTDGRVFAIGATGHTALYLPPADPSAMGVWTAGPDFPQDAQGNLMEAKDAPACLLPNGHVLCVAGPGGLEAEGPDYPGPTSFFEFDGTNLIPVPNSPADFNPPFVGRMLLLPTGQVLFSTCSEDIEVYTPDGAPDDNWRPRITGCPTFIRPGQTYTLEGQQLNGLSQAVSYGDDATMATNYPLVRIQHDHSGHVWYCRTFGHSLGVATGAAVLTTNFEVALDVEAGIAQLSVVANGIASESVPIEIEPFDVKTALSGLLKVSQLTGNLTDGPLWVITPHGLVPVGPQDVQPWNQAQNLSNNGSQSTTSGSGSGPGPQNVSLWNQVQSAYEMIFNGLSSLEQLGDTVLSQRLSAPFETPRPIPRSNEEQNKEKKNLQAGSLPALPTEKDDAHS